MKTRIIAMAVACVAMVISVLVWSRWRATSVPVGQDQRQSPVGTPQQVGGGRIDHVKIGERRSELSAVKNVFTQGDDAREVFQQQSSRRWEPMPVAVRPILGQTADQDVGSRMQAVWALKGKLTETEALALSGFLRANGRIDGVDDNHLRALKNEIMDALMTRQPSDSSVTELLIDLYHDLHQDPVIRDYAIQHLGSWYTQMPDPGLEGDQRPAIQQVLWEALRETDSSIAGTALLALRKLTDTQSEIDPVQVKQAALQLAASDHCGDLSRSTALSVCGRMQVAEVLPTARRLAVAAPSVPLQLAAIAVLGDLGEPREQALLQRISDKGDERLQAATQSALRRLAQAKTQAVSATFSIEELGMQ